MKKSPLIIAVLALAIPAVLAPMPALAHQPRLVNEDRIQISDPEISKAWYDELPGSPRTYLLESSRPFNMYLNLLVPRDENGAARYSAEVIDTASGQEVASLPANAGPWKEFYEEFAGDWYVQGPELDVQMPAGSYSIVVSGNGNRGKYVLATGKEESFPFAETINAFQVIPVLKSDFFKDGAYTFAASLMGGAFIAILVLAGFLIHLVIRLLFKAFSRKYKPGTNIGTGNRLAKGLIGLGVLLAGIFLWSPPLFALAGFFLHSPVTGWCVIDELLKKK